MSVLETSGDLNLASESGLNAPIPIEKYCRQTRAFESIDASQLGSADNESLKAAFDFFNETSKQLESSYRHLEQRVGQLTQELDHVSAEKEQAQKQGDTLANQMQALLDFLPGGVVVLDARGVIVKSNPAAQVLLDDSMLDGRLWRKVIEASLAPRNDDGMEVSTKSGKRLSVATSSLKNQGQIILLTDHTETRQLQQNLSRYERLSALGKMVSALAHQIRTPLAAALLYAGHLCDKQLDESKRDVFSKKLHGRLQHMERQVRDMLLYVKSELPLNDEVTVAELESELLEAVEHPLSCAKMACHWSNGASDVRLKCHKDALISGIVNLVNNSIQASRSGQAITIEFRTQLVGVDRQLRIRILDEGEGMSQASLASAKDLFFTSKAQGTGLGLAVVQSVAKAHGGCFSLQSKEGEGTVAEIVLPVFPQKSLAR